MQQTDLQYINNKSHIIYTFEEYLKLVDYTNYSDFSTTLIDLYYQQYYNNKIVNSYTVGHFLKNIIDINQDNKIIIEKNIDSL